MKKIIVIYIPYRGYNKYFFVCETILFGIGGTIRKFLKFRCLLINDGSVVGSGASIGNNLVQRFNEKMYLKYGVNRPLRVHNEDPNCVSLKLVNHHVRL